MISCFILSLFPSIDMVMLLLFVPLVLFLFPLFLLFDWCFQQNFSLSRCFYAVRSGSGVVKGKLHGIYLSSLLSLFRYAFQFRGCLQVVSDVITVLIP